jgi:hypothetical protein
LIFPTRDQLVVATERVSGRSFPTEVNVPINRWEDNGSFSARLHGNDCIHPAGTLWELTFLLPGINAAPRRYDVRGTDFNLNAERHVTRESFSEIETPRGVKDGVNRVFTLSFEPVPRNSLVLTLNRREVNCDIVEKTLTLLAHAPGPSDDLVARYRHG